MKEAHFTRQERLLIHWLRFLTLAFAGALITLAFLPNLFFSYLNDIGRVFFNFPSSMVQTKDWDMWRLFGVILMGILLLLAFRAQRNWLRFYNFVPLLILSKGLCFLGFLGLIFWTPSHFFYVVGSIVDGLLFLLTWYYYAQAINSRPTITPHAG